MASTSSRLEAGAPVRALRTPPLALHLFVLGLGIAILSADFVGLSDTHRPSSAARSLVLVLVPLTLTALGLALSSRTLIRRPWTSLAIMALYAPLVGAACGALAVRLGGVETFRSGADAQQIGAQLGLAALPLVALVWWRARSIGSSPAGSILDRSDHRAPWIVIALSLGLPQVAIAIAAKVQPFLLADQASAIGVLSVLGLATLVLLDARAVKAWSRFDFGGEIQEIEAADEVELARNVALLRRRARWGLAALVLCTLSVGVAHLEAGRAYALLTAGPG